MGVTIRNLSSPNELAAVDTLLQQVWGTSDPIAPVDLLRAIAHAGGYIAGAYDHDGHLVGASFGFLGFHDRELALHSHVTGILPGVQQTGIGRALKEHQRGWAAERGIAWITWTFDPLVRRNAHFNIAVLGAHVADYVENFYGQMHDSINAGDDSDRLVVAWPTSGPTGHPRDAGPAAGLVTVATPDDIVVLRRTDPAEADRWRRQVRRELGARLAAGARVVGFTDDGAYELVLPS